MDLQELRYLLDYAKKYNIMLLINFRFLRLIGLIIVK